MKREFKFLELVGSFYDLLTGLAQLLVLDIRSASNQVH